MADFIRRPLEYLQGTSTVTKPTGENWLVDGMFWWEPDTGKYYRYLLDSDTWEELNIAAAP